jgi:hypothetical protein
MYRVSSQQPCRTGLVLLHLLLSVLSCAVYSSAALAIRPVPDSDDGASCRVRIVLQASPIVHGISLRGVQVRIDATNAKIFVTDADCNNQVVALQSNQWR